MARLRRSGLGKEAVMDFQDDAAEFSSEDVDTIVKNAITGCLTDVMYNPKKVSLPRSRRHVCALFSSANSSDLLHSRSFTCFWNLIHTADQNHPTSCIGH